MGGEVLIVAAWFLCLLGSFAIVSRMLWTGRRVEALVAVVASSIAILAVLAPRGPEVWTILGYLAVLTALSSLVSLVFSLRWPVVVFGDVLPIVAVFELYYPQYAYNAIGVIGELAMLFVPLFFVLSSVFLSGALIRRLS